jgi:iron complex transport system ATP-binding protein
MNLSGFEDRQVATLSGGERRRLAMARLLTQDPAVLLLDEPVNHLDPRHQIDTLEYVSALAVSGRGVIMTLHDPSLAMRFASHILMLFSDGNWILDKTRAALTTTNLTRLFQIQYSEYVNAQGNIAFLPGA